MEYTTPLRSLTRIESFGHTSIWWRVRTGQNTTLTLRGLSEAIRRTHVLAQPFWTEGKERLCVATVFTRIFSFFCSFLSTVVCAVHPYSSEKEGFTSRNCLDPTHRARKAL